MKKRKQKVVGPSVQLVYPEGVRNLPIKIRRAVKAECFERYTKVHQAASKAWQEVLRGK